MNKSESRYFNTAVRMDEALLKLLETKDFEYITVKEICEKAGVNRSTFYLHYETIGDLLEECIRYLSNRFLEYMELDHNTVVEGLKYCPESELYLVTPEYLKPYLRYIKEHKRLFCAAVKNPSVFRTEDIYDRMFMNVFTPILDRLHVREQDRKYIMTFYIHGLMAVISQWLKADCEDTVDYVISVIQRCVIQHSENQEDL